VDEADSPMEPNLRIPPRRCMAPLQRLVKQQNLRDTDAIVLEHP
jgi:hypothetical protein